MPAHRDDPALVRDARSGDPAALAALLRRHRPRVLAVARRVVGDPDAAEDVAQVALLAAARGLPRFTGACAFGTWLHRVTLHHALNARRAARRRALGEGRGAADAEPLDPAVLLEAAEARARVRGAIGTLPALHRTCLLLRDVEGLDYGAIAARTGLPAGTVRSRLHRARARLREVLEGEVTAPGPARAGGPAAARPSPG